MRVFFECARNLPLLPSSLNCALPVAQPWPNGRHGTCFSLLHLSSYVNRAHLQPNLALMGCQSSVLSAPTCLLLAPHRTSILRGLMEEKKNGKCFSLLVRFVHGLTPHTCMLRIGINCVQFFEPTCLLKGLLSNKTLPRPPFLESPSQRPSAPNARRARGERPGCWCRFGDKARTGSLVALSCHSAPNQCTIDWSLSGGANPEMGSSTVSELDCQQISVPSPETMS